MISKLFINFFLSRAKISNHVWRICVWGLRPLTDCLGGRIGAFSWVSQENLKALRKQHWGKVDGGRKPEILSFHGLSLQNLYLQGKEKVTFKIFRSTRIFKSLSKFLKTRTPRQCRSHFQKIIGKYKTVKKVKQYYQDLLGVINYQKRFDEVAKEL